MRGIPLFVTREARFKLFSLGWSDTQIQNMTALVADGLIRMNYRAPSVLKDRLLTGKCSNVGKQHSNEVGKQQSKEVDIHILCVWLFVRFILFGMEVYE